MIVAIVILSMISVVAAVAIRYRNAARPQSRDAADRRLALAAAALPPERAEWGEAMRAELAAIDDPRQRRRFARSASIAALTGGLRARLLFVLIAAALASVAVLAASRLQMSDAGPGVLGVVAFAPAIILAALAIGSSWATRSFAAGAVTGLSAWLASLVAVAVVVAVEGMVWMDRHGVFVLDGDPPREPVTTYDVSVDLFTTGMWIVALWCWLPAMLGGAAIGAAIGLRARPVTRAPLSA